MDLNLNPCNRDDIYQMNGVKNISRGAIFRDFVTIRTEASI
jgi:hypothetical protein